MPATLKSRIPQIQAALPVRVGVALKAGTEPIAREAAANAPVGEHHEHSTEYPEGSLRDSIEARTSTIAFGGRSAFYQSGLAQQHGFSGFLRPQDQAHGTAFGIWAAWYYRFVEFGTAHQAPQPFLMPAVEAGKERLVATVEASLRTL